MSRFASFEKEAVELSRENNTASIELSQLKHKLSEKEGEIEALTRQTQVLQRTQREADAHLWWKYVWSELRRLKSTEFGEKGTSNFVDQQSLPKNLCQDPVQAQALEILSLRQVRSPTISLLNQHSAIRSILKNFYNTFDSNSCRHNLDIDLNVTNYKLRCRKLNQNCSIKNTKRINCSMKGI